MPEKQFKTSTPHRLQGRPPIRNHLLKNNYSGIMPSDRESPVVKQDAQGRLPSLSPNPPRKQISPKPSSPKTRAQTKRRERGQTEDKEGSSGEKSESENDDEQEPTNPESSEAIPDRPEELEDGSGDYSTTTDHKISDDPPSASTNYSPLISYILVVLVSVSAVALGVYNLDNLLSLSGEDEADTSTYSLSNVRIKFPQQDDILWLSLEQGIHDVTYYSRPSTFILVYTPEAERTLNELVEELSKFALCQLSMCSETPIVLNETLLNSVQDHGVLIARYAQELRQKAVMIVRNLENVNSTPAQAFHSFCDQENPLVGKSVFIFTMKFDSDKKHDTSLIKSVEGVLRERWSDLKGDVFYPLITRIVNIALLVVP